MKLVKVVFAVAALSSFAACKPAACRKYTECCQSISTTIPQAGVACPNTRDMTGDQCQESLTALRVALSGVTANVPAACN